jgi:hypothetical protein
VFSPCWARNSLLGPIPCWARPAGLLPACSCCCRASCCGAGGAVSAGVHPERTGRVRPHAAGDCKRESSPRVASQLAKMQSQVGRQGQSRVRPGQVADAMRARAGVAPRVASGDRATSKGKPAGGCSSSKAEKS